MMSIIYEAGHLERAVRWVCGITLYLLDRVTSPEFSRCDTLNPQTAFQEFITRTTSMAKRASRVANGKLTTLINRHKEEYQGIINKPISEEHEATLSTLRARINELETSLHPT